MIACESVTGLGETGDHTRVLLLDDNREFVDATRRLLKLHGFDVVGCLLPGEALELLAADASAFDVAMFDVELPEMSGVEVLKRAQELAPELPIIMVSGDHSANTATRALHAGAFDYQTKPISEMDAFVLSLSRAGQHGRLQRRARALESRVTELDEYGRTIVGSSLAMRRVFEAIAKVAATSVNVVILGESGTGKELVAHAIHARSERTAGPFVAVNCAGLPEGLIDSELFGHSKGAFTGAIKARAGAFERANHGTLFLDEIGDLPLTVQGRLLRVIQEGETRPVGEDVPRRIDVRLIAATLVDLRDAVQRKEFRNDLYYRLNVVSIELPPLRERRDDLAPLCAYFLRKHGPPMGKAGVRLCPRAFEALERYDWPGNVRELENAIQRALAMTTDDEIDLDVLPPEIEAGRQRPAVTAAPGEQPWGVEMPFANARLAAQRDFEQRYLTGLLRATEGNVSEAARRAGMDRSNFRKLLSRNEIDAEQFRPAGV